MNNRRYSLFLVAEAIIIFILTKGLNLKPESIFDLLSFPLKKTADFLGYLSLKSSTGNVIAIILFVLLCLTPIYVLLFKIKRKTFVKTDSLLVLLSSVLFAVIYLLINPSEMGLLAQTDGNTTVAFSFWSLLIGYLVLKFTDKLKTIPTEKNENLLALLIKITGAVFVFSFCNTEFIKTEVVIVSLLTFISSALPSVLGLVIVFACLKVISCFSLNRYSENTLTAAKKLSALCITSLKISICSTSLLAVLQLRFINELTNINFSITIPLIPLCFILLVLIMTGFLKEAIELKEDNDSFI